MGTPLIKCSTRLGRLPQARYVVYFTTDSDWWESIDMADAVHPQTLLTWGMNGGDLPVPFGGPLRMRVPRQLGYKSLKYVTKLTVTDNLKKFGSGLARRNRIMGIRGMRVSDGLLSIAAHLLLRKSCLQGGTRNRLIGTNSPSTSASAMMRSPGQYQYSRIRLAGLSRLSWELLLIRDCARLRRANCSRCERR